MVLQYSVDYESNIIIMVEPSSFLKGSLSRRVEKRTKVDSASMLVIIKV